VVLKVGFFCVGLVTEGVPAARTCSLSPLARVASFLECFEKMK
jgi:hypothetical protein